ncbi:MAG: metallophosphoesterase [Melioribacteraceae bacterium]
MVAVIGDIHGCYFTLLELYDSILSKYPNIKIYSVGDLFDRGKHSSKVVDFIKEKEIEFVPGNHDFMFSHFFEKPASIFAQTWSHNDNQSTLASYADDESKVWQHIKFINEQPLLLNLDDCFITHAGLSSYYKKEVYKNNINIEFISQLIKEEFSYEHGVMWNRDKLLDIGKLQVVGHTPKNEITYDKKTNSLYIDTGAFLGNKLSCAIIENSKWIDEVTVKTIQEDLL